MRHELLFKIYNNARVIKSHDEVKLPEIKPQFVTLTQPSIAPIRKHYQINNWG